MTQNLLAHKQIFFSQMSAKQNAQKAYQEVLKKEGLTEEAVNDLFTKPKRRLSSRSYSVNSDISCSGSFVKSSPKHSAVYTPVLIKSKSLIGSETMSLVGEMADLEECYDSAADDKFTFIS